MDMYKNPSNLSTQSHTVAEHNFQFENPTIHVLIDLHCILDPYKKNPIVAVFAGDVCFCFWYKCSVFYF